MTYYYLVLRDGWRSGYDDVIKWNHFPRYWPFVRGFHRCPVNSSHKGQWRGALISSLICVWINGWVNNRDFIGYRAHYDVTVINVDHVVRGLLFVFHSYIWKFLKNVQRKENQKSIKWLLSLSLLLAWSLFQSLILHHAHNFMLIPPKDPKHLKIIITPLTSHTQCPSQNHSKTFVRGNGHECSACEINSNNVWEVIYSCSRNTENLCEMSRDIAVSNHCKLWRTDRNTSKGIILNTLKLTYLWSWFERSCGNPFIGKTASLYPNPSYPCVISICNGNDISMRL